MSAAGAWAVCKPLLPKNLNFTAKMSCFLAYFHWKMQAQLWAKCSLNHYFSLKDLAGKWELILILCHTHLWTLAWLHSSVTLAPSINCFIEEDREEANREHSTHRGIWMLFHLRFAAKQELQVFICFPSRLNCSIQLKGHISIKAIDALESRLYADDVSCSVCTHITTYITYYITHNPEIPSCFNNVI